MTSSLTPAAQDIVATAPDHPARTWSRSGRLVAATTLVVGPALWSAAQFAGIGLHGANKLAWQVANPVTAGLGLIADAVGTFFMVGAVVVWFLLSRPRSPRLAIVGAVLLGIALSLQSIVSGIEIAHFALARSGALSLPTLDSALESSQNLGLPGQVLLPLWLVTPKLGIIVMMIALWRSRTVARVAIFLVLASQVLELVGIPLPGDWLLSLVGTTWMAFAVLTVGATDRR